MTVLKMQTCCNQMCSSLQLKFLDDLVQVFPAKDISGVV